MNHNPDNVSLRAYYNEDSDQPAIVIRETYPISDDDVEIHLWGRVTKDGELKIYQDTMETPLYVFELARLIKKNFTLLYRSLKN